MLAFFFKFFSSVLFYFESHPQNIFQVQTNNSSWNCRYFFNDDGGGDEAENVINTPIPLRHQGKSSWLTKKVLLSKEDIVGDGEGEGSRRHLEETRGEGYEKAQPLLNREADTRVDTKVWLNCWHRHGRQNKSE